mmetsp:Transcript_21214/g.70418  ORF Transcript_21214/g.70418 Transcript_21214/m.70418 type:complete len:85 (-) Transcript_21214:214-468(-)
MLADGKRAELTGCDLTRFSSKLFLKESSPNRSLKRDSKLCLFVAFKLLADCIVSLIELPQSLFQQYPRLAPDDDVRRHQLSRCQ